MGWVSDLSVCDLIADICSVNLQATKPQHGYKLLR